MINQSQRHAALTAAPAAFPHGVSLWDRMVLAPSDWGPVDRASMPLGAFLGLRTVEKAAVVSSGDCRATPSAGAIYPYEFYVIAGQTDAVVLAADPVRRLARRIGVEASMVATQCRRAGVGTPPEGGALLIVVSRPWLSMRKYDDRGYLYTQLDAAHVAVNALGVAGAHGALRTRLTPGPLERLLGIEDRCREIHSVLRLDPSDPEQDAGDWTVRQALPGVPPPGAAEPSWLERTCWQTLRPLLSDGSGAPEPGSAPLVRLTTTLDPDTGASDELVLDTTWVTSRWAELSRRRASSKQFTSAEVPRSLLARVISAAGTPLHTDLPPDGDLHMTLLARTVSGLRPGYHRLTDGVTADTATQCAGQGAAAGTDAAYRPPTDDDVVRATMHQKHLRDAAAFVLFHAPRADLVANRSAHLRELLLRAGGVAHLLYLGATDAGLGVTAVGGFDADMWRDFTRLPAAHDPVYLLSFGTAGAGRVKWDRLATPYAREGR